jgi:hypothetical protein
MSVRAIQKKQASYNRHEFGEDNYSNRTSGKTCS